MAESLDDLSAGELCGLLAMCQVFECCQFTDKEMELLDRIEARLNEISPRPLSDEEISQSAENWRQDG